MANWDLGHGIDERSGLPEVGSTRSTAALGQKALEIYVFAAPLVALLGSAASDIYLSLSAVGFLLWRVLTWFRRELELPGQNENDAPAKHWALAPWFLAALGFWTWAVFTALNAIDPSAALRDALVWIRFPVFAAAMWVVVGGSPTLRHRLLQGMILGAVIMAAILFVERLNNPSVSRLYGPWSSGPKPGWYMLGFGLPLACWAMLRLDRSAAAGLSPQTVGFSAMLILFPIATFATGEVMNSFSFAFGLGLLGIIGGLAPKRLVLLSGVVAVLFVAFIAVNEHAFWSYADRLITRLPWRPTSDYYPAWHGALVLGWSEWLIGVGPGGFPHACEAVGAEALGVSICLPHPHQAYLQMFVETGLPGLLLFSVAILSAVIYAARRWRETGDIEAGAAMALLVVVFLPFATYSDAFGQHKNFFTWLNAGWALALAASATPKRAHR